MPLPTNQNWLIERMKELGYEADPEGVCFGVAHMGIHAILTRDLTSFDKLLEKSYSIPVADFADTINAQKEKRKKKKGLPIDPLLEIPAFFEGIELYQQPFLYPGLFEPEKTPKMQDALVTSPLLIPPSLIEKDGLIKSTPFIGIYDETKLSAYFKSLRHAANNTNPSLTSPIALALNSCNHTIAVGYDPETDEWLLIDGNKLPTKHIKASTNQIAKKIIKALSESDIAVFSTEIYGAVADAAELNECVTNWCSQESWKQIHTFSSENFNTTDSFNGSLLYLAVENSQRATVEALIERGANPNLVIAESGSFALLYATQNNDAAIVDALLNAGADPDLTESTHTTSSLYVAAYYGNADIAKSLLDAGAEPNLGRTNSGTSALYVAVQKGHLDIVNLLLDYHANPDLGHTNRGISPLYVAAQKGHVDIVKSLLAANANSTIMNTNGSTPILTAAKRGHKKIVDLLIEANAHLYKKSSDKDNLILGSDQDDVEKIPLQQLAGKFISWINHHDKPQQSDNENLISWLIKNKGFTYIRDYNHFCDLAISLYSQGYATVPPPSERKYINSIKQYVAESKSAKLAAQAKTPVTKKTKLEHEHTIFKKKKVEMPDEYSKISSSLKKHS